MKQKIMVLSSLYVKELYGKYDYDIDFNEDITLIYGTNGCGKTTILNIITAIITGGLFRLFTYNFKDITLKYFNESAKENPFCIIISKVSETELEVDFNGQKGQIVKLQGQSERRQSVDSLATHYFEEYSILDEIKREFNYVYLALNRSGTLPEEDGHVYLNRRRYYTDEEYEIIEPERIDPEIRAIERLIIRRYMLVTSQVNAINNEFRNTILKSALDVNVLTDLGKFLNDFNAKKLKGDNILKIRDSYVKILNDLRLITEDEKKQYNVFFENYSKKIQNIGNTPIQLEEMFSLFVENYEMKKIKGIVDIAAEMEKRKAVVMRPFELFLDSVNEFVSASDYKKEVDIDANGHIYFTTEDGEQHLSIQFLSSGERQLLIFFANLIFGVKDTSSGIFVVDEPELSLHLSWQKVFVRKALAINNNVQFIFATHSPEIVGSYRNKTKKLQRINAK